MKLPAHFYTRSNVVKIASDLLGKVLYTNFNGRITAGIITETEAYAGINDRASHAYGNRRTGRTEVMYAAGGVAYVYLCYGIHHLFNVVTNAEDVPHAILVRAIRPVEGLLTVQKRRNGSIVCNGPGMVSQALGIKTLHSGCSLTGDKIWIEDKGIIINTPDIKKNPRIGVSYAGADALLPYRFTIDI